MAKTNKDDFSYEMIEFLGSIKESPSSDWSKSVARISWNGNPSTIDIRNMNLGKDIMGKGISLSDEEADSLVDLLLSEDYGSIEMIESALNKKKCRFTYSDDDSNICIRTDNILKIDIE